MAKNRLEEAFRSDSDPPPNRGGGSRPMEVTAEMLAESLPGNYFASEQERVRWQIIHQYDKEGRIAEVWNHPFFQVMEPENMNNGYLLAHPPAAMEHLTSFMLMSHYREIMQRILDDPEEMKRGCQESTSAEMFAFLVEGFDSGLGEAIPQITAMGLFRCLELMYGEKDAYLFYRVQLSGYYREMENEGRTFRDNPIYTMKHAIPAARKSMKFVADQFNPGEFTNDQRRAMDNMLDAIGGAMLNVRKAVPAADNKDGMEELKAKSLTLSEILSCRDSWQDWLTP